MVSSRAASPPTPRTDDLRGVWVALVVFGIWAVSLVPAVCMPLSLSPVHVVGGIALVALRTFLCTGIFITAHDAMHGLVAPGRPRINNAIGALCTRSYAWFSFRQMRVAHHRHHDTPAREGDPDWHDGEHGGYWSWLFSFAKRYMHWSQVAVIAVVHNVSVLLCGAPEPQMWLFVWLPALLSAVQLFTFGTWLPHREPPGGHTNPHSAQSSGLPPWLSFITCYHFGYHLTHHVFPWVPWWKLPSGRRVLVGRAH
ncbi:MAG: beta-carotene ketolase [Deltaproteobacteria bacterium]|nr:beta-carotene ketolase [Deltaproteobacteria bacterium]HCH63927.1 beta-carotene ketolase [Deltaproteobacteria bacterium]